MRAGGGSRPGESMGRPGGNRDDLPTLRVTNVSEDTTDQDLRDLFGMFGRVARVYIGRDRETGVGKGYAFVSFEDRIVAERAMQKVNGMGYDNLILTVQWSRTSLSVYSFSVLAEAHSQNRGSNGRQTLALSLIPLYCTIHGHLDFCHLNPWRKPIARVSRDSLEQKESSAHQPCSKADGNRTRWIALNETQ